MIVWGGVASSGPLSNTGGRYNPGTDSWTALSNINAPTARYEHTAVWTGSEMIVWGGRDLSMTYLDTGGRYCKQEPTPPPCGVSFTLDDAAPTGLPDTGPLIDGTFKPTNIGGGDTFAPPASGSAGGSALSVFNGITPNGVWLLYVMDDLGGDVGSIGGGWELNITTTTDPATPSVNLASIMISDNGPAATYPSNIAVAGLGGTITKVTVRLNCICHTFPDDIDILLVGPGGQDAIIMSDVGGSIALQPCATPETVFGNISTRLRVGVGDNVMIGGFIIAGTQPKTVIVRGIGPSLPVTDALADPIIEVHGPSGEILAINDNWRDDPNQQHVIDSGLAPTSDLESAFWGIINPETYTVVVRGKNNATGNGLFEVYDLDRTVDSKLANISTRGFVETGDNVMIGGTIILGSTPARVLFRAMGPSLSNLGVPNALQDPTLELYDDNGTLLASNDNWRSDQEAEIIATGIPPKNELESAILRSLPPGRHTAIVRGRDNSTGVALVEAYQL